MTSTIPPKRLASADVIDLLDRRDYRAALDAIQARLGMSPPSDSTELDSLRAISGECLAILGRNDDAISICSPITEKYRSSGVHDVYAASCIGMAAALYFRGELELAAEHAIAALHAFRRIEDSRGSANALNWIGNIQFYKGDYTSARSRYQDCVNLAEQKGMSPWAIVAGLNLGLTCALSGDLNDSSTALEACSARAKMAGDELTGARCELVLGYVNILLRAFPRARMILEEVRSRVLRQSYPREQGAWCEYMGELELAEGNLIEAEKHLLHGIALASGDSRDESVIGQSRRLLSEVRMAQGDPKEAIAEGQRALESIQKVGERFEEGVVYRVFAEARTALGQDAEARADVKQSITILRTIGARLEWAKSCLSAGRAAIFSRRERLAYLIEAERLFAEIGVEFWIEQTRSLLKQVLQERDEEMQTRVNVQPIASSHLFITADSITLQTLRLAERYARTDIAILITGETGVGKDQLARFIHSISPRHLRPFIAIDLNTIPETLLESALFGHRKGSYTGATGEQVGLLESANGGTVFFNEIGNLPLTFQARLLEVLDRRQIRPLGDIKPVSLDIRFLAATNADLEEAVATGRFRPDLYYRFAEAPLHLLPLRERRADIIPLIRHFFAELGLSEAELSLMDQQLWLDRAHNGHWAGNARRLRSFVRQLVAVAERPSDPDFQDSATRLLETMDFIAEPNVGGGVSRDSLAEALTLNGWNQRAAARVLGITEGGVRHLMRRFGISRPEFA